MAHLRPGYLIDEKDMKRRHRLNKACVKGLDPKETVFPEHTWCLLWALGSEARRPEHPGKRCQDSEKEKHLAFQTKP